MELQEHLKLSFPVYALFTKADLISGFMEYFGSFSEQRRRLVWGATFQTDDKTKNKIGEVEPEFDLLIERLSEELPDRLQEEADPLSRAKLFGFPSQMAALKSTIADFLNQIFEPTRYHTNVALRGFYFTSGTQQGTPIDRLLGAMAGSFGAHGIAPAYSGRAKSFFLGDLLTKVIFGESGWVSTNREAVRRARFLRGRRSGHTSAAASTTQHSRGSQRPPAHLRHRQSPRSRGRSFNRRDHDVRRHRRAPTDA